MPTLARFVVTVLAIGAITGCSGELYFAESEASGDFDAADRDNGDPIDNTDDGSSGDGDDFYTGDGDPVLGDVIVGGDGNDCPECCGFGGVCPIGEECVVGVCVPACPTAKCGDNQLCCRGATSECCDSNADPSCGQDHCRAPCPASNVHCGTRDDICCDTTQGLTCGPNLTCVTDCSASGKGPLCAADDTHPGVCCPGYGTATPDDDDVCLYGQCYPRGPSCKSFLDCDNGFYCETTLHNPGDPTDGVCLPNSFSSGTAACLAPPDDVFNPITEWAWVGVQLVGTDLDDTNFSDNFIAGAPVVRCADASSRNCFREPCTDLPLSTDTPGLAADTTNHRPLSQCYRSIFSIPTTRDMNGDGIPEVVIKAYADNTVQAHNGNVMAIIDGRAEADRATASLDPSQRTLMVIYGEEEGHSAIGNLDGDPALEVVTAHNPGLCAYDPFDATLIANTGSALMWCTSAGSLNMSHLGGAPNLADLDNDGLAEVIFSSVVLRGTDGTVLIDLGIDSIDVSGSPLRLQAWGKQGGGSTVDFNANWIHSTCAIGGDCGFISTVYDVDLDGTPEILTGNRAYTITGSGASMQASLLWQAHHKGNPSFDPQLGPGFPGVANFIVQTSGTDTPEVATVYNGRVFIVSGETGEVLTSTTDDADWCTNTAVCRDRIGSKASCLEDAEGGPGSDNCVWNNTNVCSFTTSKCSNQNTLAKCTTATNSPHCQWDAIAAKCNPKPALVTACAAATTRQDCLNADSFCGFATPACFGNSAVCTAADHNTSGTCTADVRCTWNTSTLKCALATTFSNNCADQVDINACYAFDPGCLWRGNCDANTTCASQTSSGTCSATAGCTWGARELSFQVLDDRGGPPNIADFDGDGRPEVSFAGTGCMVVIDPDCAAATAAGRDALATDPSKGCAVIRPSATCNGHSTRSVCEADTANGCVWSGLGTPQCSSRHICNIETATDIGSELGLLWMFQTQDQSSAITGTSVFDFQGDGKAEVLYNDECFFRVFEGATARVLYERPNSHRTQTEYPIVVDVDGDSNSEIVVVSTGDQSTFRDRCGNVNQTPAACTAITDGAGDTDTTAVNECNGTQPDGATGVIVPGCHWLNGTGDCKPFSYRRNEWELYTPAACTCSDHTAQADCDAARGCRWNGASCIVVPASECNAYNKAQCQTHLDDCLWDPFQNGTGLCEETPRGQAYVCQHSTWGVTSFGDPEDKWVRTLPWWHEHPFHITNTSKLGDVIADWRPAGEPNYEFYNNFRQNVPGFVPLNAPDLEITELIADVRACPPRITLIATVVNHGRAGVLAGAPVGFYRQTASETATQTAQRPASDMVGGAAVGTSVNLLPGQSTNVSAVYDLDPSTPPINLKFRAIVNPPFVANQSGEFECNADNNALDIDNVDCVNGGS